MREDETIMEMLCRIVRPLASEKDRIEIDLYLNEQEHHRLLRDFRDAEREVRGEG